MGGGEDVDGSLAVSHDALFSTYSEHTREILRE